MTSSVSCGIFLFLIFMTVNLPLQLCIFTLMYFLSKRKNHLQSKKKPFLKGNNGASRGCRKDGRASWHQNKWDLLKVRLINSYGRCGPACLQVLTPVLCSETKGGFPSFLTFGMGKRSCFIKGSYLLKFGKANSELHKQEMENVFSLGSDGLFFF